jgi:uncharacterized protein (TIGR02452 family)
MNLVELAQQTLQVLEAGQYQAPSGRAVPLAERVIAAVKGTRLYAPGEPAASTFSGPAPQLEVTGESTVEALIRLRGAPGLCALNYASAKNPGGGFLRGARAQEEDLARCSALYPCLMTQPSYYEANRASGSMLYTDHLIFSPAVPFFRAPDAGLLEEPVCASVLTSPAPNAGEVRKQQREDPTQVFPTLLRRARQVLAVAAVQQQRTLVLGAWGCGVFRNDPSQVAEVFAQVLTEFSGAFERVVFAVYDRSADHANLGAFQRRFG